jgi:hypothetical protein
VGTLEVFGDTIYAGTNAGFGSGTVYRSQDGRKWEPIGLLSPHTIESLAGFGDHLYAGTLIPPHAGIDRVSVPNRP